MKSMNPKFKMLPLLVLGMTLITFTSCSKDEDEMEPPVVEVADIRFRVNLTKIKATDTSGEGDADNVELEIYGDLTTSLTIGTTVDTRVLWSTVYEEAIRVGQNDTQLTGEAIFTVPEDQLSNSSITCAGELDENDGGGFSQFQGDESSTFTLAAINGTQDVELTFSDTPGQTSVVTYTITRL